MALVRYVVPALVATLLYPFALAAQVPTGTITGRVTDAVSQVPLAGVTIRIEGGTRLETLTRNDGGFALGGVPAGVHRLRATRIGYAPLAQDVTVTAGGAAEAMFALPPQAALIEAVVVTGYGSQRREAITGSVATVDAGTADVGVVSNVNNMIQGRVAGLNVTTNNGEPGSGAQIRIRGGTSIRASNEPLYVIDGVPIQNVATEPGGIGVGGDPPLARSPLNLLNPSDIGSITILKDAAASAIYGSRAANGVILIETKRQGSAGGSTVEYDSYMAAASPARRLDLLNGDEYRAFVTGEVAAGRLPNTILSNLGTLTRTGPNPGDTLRVFSNTNWEDEVSRTGITTNQNFGFTGGTEATQYRASLNLMDQQGVTIANGFKRVQGRLNARHRALENRLRLTLNVTGSHVDNDYLPYEIGGGFEGGVFQNVAVFDPTHPVIDPATGKYYETGPPYSVRNPVGLANQLADFGNTTRVFGNAMAELDLVPGLTGQINVGVDRSDGLRQIYWPLASPVGLSFDGRAQQENLDNTSVTFQSYLTLQRKVGENHDLDIVGGYEFNEYRRSSFRAEGRGFLTDAFGYDNLSAAAVLLPPSSNWSQNRLISFFGRANYGYKDRFFVTGVLRYDGSTKFGSGNKWALFPALSGSWHISQESFMQNLPLGLTDLRLRLGWGKNGNQDGIPAYSSLPLVEPTGGARYPWGDATATGIVGTRNPNPDLKWEATEQINAAVDFGFMNNRISGSAEYYVKNTSDLLLEVGVLMPALVTTRIENIGKVRNRGVEIALDALAKSTPRLSWRAGLVFSANRNRVVDLGPTSFISTSLASGQGQSDQRTQRILPGYPLGTFYGRVFIRVADELGPVVDLDPAVAGLDTLWRPGQQLFRCSSAALTCVNGESRTPSASDFAVIGDANPDFELGLTNQVSFGKWDLSVLVRAVVGHDVFNNTAMVYATKGNAQQTKNFLREALDQPDRIDEPATYSSRWIEDGSFVRLQNITAGYTFNTPSVFGAARSARVYVSGDNLLLLTGYSGLDPEVHAGLQDLATRGVDYLSYPRARTFTAGLRVTF
ncbi:MAG TPA: SusC/RagA family TonB-linked outer membrane protein [Gemmatimonadales bacterium]|jgi:iron complex outermembrane receptor protein|nr:SusC/RagA family TonB-linked outer membrane protein [Gemmatimonadales bacterium]